MNRTIILLVAIIPAIFGNSSCTKEQAHAHGPDTASYMEFFTVTYLNNPSVPPSFYFPGDSIAFGVSIESNPPCNSLLLMYGDGDSSRSTFSRHVYKFPGQYTYTVTVNNGTAYSKTGQLIISVVPDSTTLAQIGRLRNWHGIVSSGSLYHIRDTTCSFAVTIINPYTIAIQMDTLRYSGSLCYYGYSGYGAASEFFYFPSNDSIYAEYSFLPPGITDINQYLTNSIHSP
jgi:hypothetical protein